MRIQDGGFFLRWLPDGALLFCFAQKLKWWQRAEIWQTRALGGTISEKSSGQMQIQDGRSFPRWPLDGT